MSNKTIKPNNPGNSSYTVGREKIDEISVSFLVEDGRKIPEVVLRINKIDPYSKEWADKSVNKKEGAKRLAEFLSDYSKLGEIIFCAYNAKFDYSFLSSLMISQGYANSVKFNGIFDPLFLSRTLTEDKKLVTKVKENGKMCHKLGSIAEGLGLEIKGDLHRASTDVSVLENVVKKLRERL